MDYPLRPVGARVIVRPDPRPAKIGSIHVPDAVQHDNPNYFTMTGVVLAVGRGVTETIPVGHKVCYNRYAGQQIRDPRFTDGADYLLVIPEEDLCGVLPPDAPVMLPGYMDAGDSGVKDLEHDWVEQYEILRQQSA